MSVLFGEIVLARGDPQSPDPQIPATVLPVRSVIMQLDGDLIRAGIQLYGCVVHIGTIHEKIYHIIHDGAPLCNRQWKIRQAGFVAFVKTAQK